VLWDRTDMPEVMAMLHLFLKTSTRSGMSLSLIEAQASGVACVIPKVRGLADYIVNGRNGIAVEPGDVLSFAEAVVSLIENPTLCHTISRMAYDLVNFNMSMPVVTNLMQRLYEDALLQ
jgi:glycosyltransferase involved in cell wall biosynthesis